MKTGLLFILIFMAAALGNKAYALITSNVITLLGVRLPYQSYNSKLWKESIDKSGLDSYFYPGITWPGDKREKALYLGKTLGTLNLNKVIKGKAGDKNHSAIAMPEIAEIKNLKIRLSKLGILLEPKIYVFIYSEGGK